METDKLIAALAQDAGPARASLARVRMAALALASLAAFGAFAVFVGPRGDIFAALETPRFVLKPVLTLALFATAFAVLARMMRPGARVSPRRWVLMLSPTILGIAVVCELILVPSDQWVEKLVGSNAVLCLTVLPALSIGPLLVLLWAMRQTAPTNPVRAGAVAGLAAAALGATFYALNCTDDSPLFVAVWYPLATAIVVGIGALLGRKWLRW